MHKQIIAVDFDGTLCENKWPEIGEPNTELIGYLIMMQKTEQSCSIMRFWPIFIRAGGTTNSMSGILSVTGSKSCRIAS